MKTPTPHAAVAKALRAELKGAGIAPARVRSSAFAGGASVHAEVPAQHVATAETICAKYRAGSFDGMSDCFVYDNRDASVPQIKYVSVQAAR